MANFKNQIDEDIKYYQFQILSNQVLHKHLIISPKNGQKIPKITNLQYNKGRANYGTKKKSIYG